MSAQTAKAPRQSSRGRQGSAHDAGAECALVRVAVPLDDQEVKALRTALSRAFKRPLELEIETRPEIIGGVWVRVGDTVIDGSLRGKLETLRQHLRAQCTSIITASMWSESKGTRS